MERALSPGYPSVKNLYASNGVQGKGIARGPEFGFSSEAFGQVDSWLVTEKVDGMNVRVIFNHHMEGAGGTVRFAGRTDKANLPGDLLAYLTATFTEDLFMTAFANEDGDVPGVITLYGEGFGAGIQAAGKHYGPDKRFILFDTYVDGRWLRWSDVVNVAEKLGIPTVPVLWVDATLEQAKSAVCDSLLLHLDDSEHIEGIVARTDPYLFTQYSERVMFKYKVRDL